MNHKQNFNFAMSVVTHNPLLPLYFYLYNMHSHIQQIIRKNSWIYSALSLKFLYTIQNMLDFSISFSMFVCKVQKFHPVLILFKYICKLPIRIFKSIFQTIYFHSKKLIIEYSPYRTYPQ